MQPIVSQVEIRAICASPNGQVVLENRESMSSPPRIWLDYRPLRIGWVVSDRNIEQLATMATWNTCLWGGRYNCVIPVHDAELSERLVSSFAVDVLLPVQANEATKAFIDRFAHLKLHRWDDSIFRQHDCEFADIRHAIRRAAARQDEELAKRFSIPVWTASDPLAVLFAIQFGSYPTTNADIADYKGGVKSAIDTEDVQLSVDAELPITLLEAISPLRLTGYDTSLSRNRRGWLGNGVVLGSIEDFDALAMYWNLRAAGASLIFYDQLHGARLRPFANAFVQKFRKPSLDGDSLVNVWIRCDHPRDDS
jgi:hypothetical protein